MRTASMQPKLCVRSIRKPAEPGRLFHVEDFAVAGLTPQAIWERVSTIAVREQASDIHLTHQRDGLHVALRLDGRMWPQGVLPAELAGRLVNHVKVAAQLDVSEKRRPQDGRIELEVDGRRVDVRVAVFPGSHGEDLAIRLLDREMALLDLEELGFSERQLRDVQQLLESPSGLILVTGATGAGKTTTLYALLRRLADGTRKVLTVEDPVEFDLPNVNQSQTNEKIGNDFNTLLRAALRQDSNVLMIGEVRDAESAEAVVRAANAGRLVLATSHALHVGAAVESLIQLGAAPQFVGRALRGVIAQTLVRRLCPYCTVRLEETAGVALLGDFPHQVGGTTTPALSMGRGCPHCRHTGYRGRIGLCEVLVADEKLRALCGTGAAARELYDYGVNQRMMTISEAGRLAALSGLTTIEETLQSISEIWTGAA